MSRIGLYILLVLIYLGLSKSFLNDDEIVTYIKSPKVLSSLFPGNAISVILIDQYETGLFIKSFHHRYKIIYGFNPVPKFISTKVSQEFYKLNGKNIGLSLFRRGPNGLIESTVPAPPGSLYVGDLAFGNWRYKDSGEKVWKFHNAYQNFPKLFGWKKFTPNHQYYKTMKIHFDKNEPFYGLNNEFGTEGSLSTYKKNIDIQASLKKELTTKLFFSKYLNLTSKWIYK